MSRPRPFSLFAVFSHHPLGILLVSSPDRTRHRLLGLMLASSPVRARQRPFTFGTTECAAHMNILSLLSLHAPLLICSVCWFASVFSCNIIHANLQRNCHQTMIVETLTIMMIQPHPIHYRVHPPMSMPLRPEIRSLLRHRWRVPSNIFHRRVNLCSRAHPCHLDSNTLHRRLL